MKTEQIEGFKMKCKKCKKDIPDRQRSPAYVICWGCFRAMGAKEFSKWKVKK